MSNFSIFNNATGLNAKKESLIKNIKLISFSVLTIQEDKDIWNLKMIKHLKNLVLVLDGGYLQQFIKVNTCPI